MRTKFLWVLYFRQVGDLPDIFQNHDSRMIFSKLNLNLVKIWRNLRNKMRFDFFVPINFKGNFFHKSGLAQVSTKNTGRSVSLFVLNSIIDVEESVSFLRHRQSS